MHRILTSDRVPLREVMPSLDPEMISVLDRETEEQARLAATAKQARREAELRRREAEKAAEETAAPPGAGA